MISRASRSVGWRWPPSCVALDRPTLEVMVGGGVLVAPRGLEQRPQLVHRAPVQLLLLLLVMVAAAAAVLVSW